MSENHRYETQYKLFHNITDMLEERVAQSLTT